MKASVMLTLLNEQKKANEDKLKLVEAVQRLSQNKDYQLVIRDMYLRDQAMAYLAQSADSRMTPAQRADSLAMAQATGYFRVFLSDILMTANQAARDITEVEQNIEELRVLDPDEEVE